MTLALADLEKKLSETAAEGMKAVEEADKLRAAGEEVTEELNTAITTKADEVGKLQADIAGLRVTEDGAAKLRAAQEAAKKAEEEHRQDRPSVYGRGGDDKEDSPLVHPLRAPGRVFIESEEYKAWMARFPKGGPNQKATIFSDEVQVPGFRYLLGLRTASEEFDAVLRTLVTSVDTSAGDLVRPDFRGLLEPGLIRPLTIRQLVTVLPTSSDTIEYVKELSREAVAAPVGEATATTGTTGTKPEGGVVFDVVVEAIQTIAVWVPATRRILSDAPQLRAYIEQYLRDDVSLELEDQMVTGSGAGLNFTGILNEAGIGDAGAPGAGESAFDVMREAQTLVRNNGRTEPTAVILNPLDSAKIDLLKVNAEVNHFVGTGPFGYVRNQPLWGMPRVETQAITAGTGLLGDFRRAILWDREDTSLQVGTAGDDFIRNIVRILAEGRWGFGVVRPAAFAKFTIP
jgi:HK97 family phage major capsid protein